MPKEDGQRLQGGAGSIQGPDLRASGRPLPPRKTGGHREADKIEGKANDKMMKAFHRIRVLTKIISEGHRRKYIWKS